MRRRLVGLGRERGVQLAIGLAYRQITLASVGAARTASLANFWRLSEKERWALGIMRHAAGSMRPAAIVRRCSNSLMLLGEEAGAELSPEYNHRLPSILDSSCIIFERASGSEGLSASTLL